jgi:hypothetical protein
MYQLNAIDPQYYSLPGGYAWSLQDLSYDIPEGATGAILQVKNADEGYSNRFACRKPGAAYNNYHTFKKGGTLWVIVGLDENRCFETRFQNPGYLNAYLMGYTGRDVVFPDTPIDIKPAVDNTYHTTDIGATWPDAKLLLTDLGSMESFNDYFSIRPDGSSKEIYGGGDRKFPIVGVPDNGKIQTKLSRRDGGSTGWYAYAYLKKDCSFSLNGIDFIGFTANDWKTLQCRQFNPAARWAIFEFWHPVGYEHVSARKCHSFFDYQGDSANHSFFISNLHHDGDCQVYSGNTSATDKLYQIAETH